MIEFNRGSISNAISFKLKTRVSRLGIKPTTSHPQGGCSNRQATATVGIIDINVAVKVKLAKKSCKLQTNTSSYCSSLYHLTTQKLWLGACSWFLSVFNPFLHNDTFWAPGKQAFWKQWEKEKLLVTSNFSYSRCFLPVWITFFHFRQIWNCHLQTPSVWKSLEFVVW